MTKSVTLMEKHKVKGICMIWYFSANDIKSICPMSCPLSPFALLTMKWQSLVCLTLSARLDVSGLPLNWLAYGWLDTVNASCERGRGLGGGISHWEKNMEALAKCLKCLGRNSSIWKTIDWATTAVWIAISPIYFCFIPGLKRGNSYRVVSSHTHYPASPFSF